MADPHATAPSAVITALRRLREDNVPLPCTIQAIRDFVYYDLFSSDTIADVHKFKDAITTSSKRVNTLCTKCDELGVNQQAELDSFTGRVSSIGLLGEKQNLVSLIERALMSLKDICEYELKQLVDVSGDVFSLQRALHLDFLLPPEITSSGRRYWKEVAVLMNAAKQVWRQGATKLRGQSRTYSEQALQKLSKRFTDDDRRTLREALSAGIPEFFPRVFEMDEKTISEIIAEARRFKPSEKVVETMRIARSVRDGKVIFQEEASPS